MKGRDAWPVLLCQFRLAAIARTYASCLRLAILYFVGSFGLRGVLTVIDRIFDRALDFVDHVVIFGALMGALWMLSMTVYGRAAELMGDLGGSAGWAIFMGCVIITSNLWGILAGEWRGCTGTPTKTMYVGLITILVAVGIIGYGTSL